MRILVVNAGSSSLKLSVLDGDDLVAAHDIKMSPGSRIDEQDCMSSPAGWVGSTRSATGSSTAELTSAGPS